MWAPTWERVRGAIASPWRARSRAADRGRPPGRPRVPTSRDHHADGDRPPTAPRRRARTRRRQRPPPGREGFRDTGLPAAGRGGGGSARRAARRRALPRGRCLRLTGRRGGISGRTGRSRTVAAGRGSLLLGPGRRKRIRHQPARPPSGAWLPAVLRIAAAAYLDPAFQRRPDRRAHHPDRCGPALAAAAVPGGFPAMDGTRGRHRRRQPGHPRPGPTSPGWSSGRRPARSRTCTKGDVTVVESTVDDLDPFGCGLRSFRRCGRLRLPAGLLVHSFVVRLLSTAAPGRSSPPAVR